MAKQKRQTAEAAPGGNGAAPAGQRAEVVNGSAGDGVAAAVDRGRRGDLTQLRLRTFRSLKSRNFRYLWLGQISNSLGIWMEMVARPLLVLQLTDNAVHLGLVLTVRTIPQLFIGLFSGTLADRYNRRLILIFAKTGATLTNGVLVVLILSGQVELWHVYATAAAKSFFNAFDQPARQALIPTLVPQDQVVNAVAFNSSTMAVARIGGSSLAGIMVATVGIGYTFLASTLLIGAAVLFTILMRIPAQAKARQGISSFFSEFSQGIRYVWQAPDIRSLLLLAMTWFTFGMSYTQVFVPLLAKQVMHIGNAGYGYLIATAGVGSMIGGLVVASRESVGRRGLLLPFIMAAFGVLLMLFSLAASLSWVVLAFGVIVLIGACQTFYGSLSNSALMQLAQDEMRGRVFGINSMDRAVTSGGAALAGFLAAGVGAQEAQAIFGGLILAVGAGWVIFGKTLRRVD